MLYIVIPVFNRKHFTLECLLSLRKQTNKNFRVIVVDDGSTDGTGQLLAQDFPEVTVLKGDGNLFWTAATNMGVQYALAHGARHVMTLNNDTLATPDFIEKMYRWAAQKPDALLGALAVDAATGKPVYGGETINWFLNSYKPVLKTLSANQQTGLHKVTHFPGRGLWIPKKVFDTIGLFDEKKFPHYYADYDFTHTASRAGFDIYCNYDARLLTYPTESGERQLRRKKSLGNYYNHLFGIRGGGNLLNFTKFTFKNCPPLYIPIVLVNGYIRRVFGYLIK
jgi:GT2 family glycosyltransferase